LIVHALQDRIRDRSGTAIELEGRNMIVDRKGYEAAVSAVKDMDANELAEYLDSLYGRSELPRACTVDDMRRLALEQTERIFGPDYERAVRNERAAFAASLVPGRTEKQQES
jgi:hypothetical protein